MFYSSPADRRCSVIAVITLTVLASEAVSQLETQQADSNVHNVTVPDVWRKMPSGALVPIGGGPG